MWQTAKEVFTFFFFNCHFLFIFLAAANTVDQAKPDTSEKKLEPATEVRHNSDPRQQAQEDIIVS